VPSRPWSLGIRMPPRVRESPRGSHFARPRASSGPPSLSLASCQQKRAHARALTFGDKHSGQGRKPLQRALHVLPDLDFKHDGAVIQAWRPYRTRGACNPPFDQYPNDMRVMFWPRDGNECRLCVSLRVVVQLHIEHTSVFVLDLRRICGSRYV